MKEFRTEIQSEHVQLNNFEVLQQRTFTEMFVHVYWTFEPNCNSQGIKWFSCVIQHVDIIYVDEVGIRTPVRIGKDVGSTKDWVFDFDYSGWKHPYDFTPGKVEIDFKKATVNAII